MISLGCAKNLVDSEVMLGHLDRAGCAFVRDPGEADVIVVNTCGFIEAAREESIQTILEAAEYKRTGRLRRLIVAGCMVQRYAAELREQLPEVDAFIGLDELERIVDRTELAAQPSEAAARARPGIALHPAELGPTPVQPSTVAAWGAAHYLYDDQTPRRLATPDWTAYIKIAEGCDHSCSFCAIPTFRGAFRSRQLESIVREAHDLVRLGVREINLIAQDSSQFGRDRGERNGLVHLLEALNTIPQLRWIRLHYLYPNSVTPELIRAMARLPKVLGYIDLPLQHAHPATLQRMRRGGSAAAHSRLLERIRREMPDVTLRTTFIVGFPGETEGEFQALLEFVEAARFDHVGVFTYSHEERTPAYGLEDDVPPPIKQSRMERLMARQQSVVFTANADRIGRREIVVVEGSHPDTDDLLVGRTWRQAPQVDGQVLLNDGAASPGDFVDVEFTDVAGYDLVARIIGPA
jgi:ribosomal protein S12 methylthiotransferase